MKRNTKQRRAPRKAQKPKRAQPKRSQPKAGYYLSPCALNYMRALLDPFSNDFPEMPCIPDMITTPSHKFRTVARGFGYVGTNNFGFVAFNPFSSAWSDPTPQQPTIYASQPTYTGVATDALITPTSIGAAAWNTNSRYTGTILNAAGVRIRLVGAGVRITYVGTELNMGGQYTLVRAQGNSTLTGISPSAATAYQQSTITGVTRRTVGMTYHPANADLLDYQPLSTFDSAATPPGNYGGVYPYAIYFNGTPGNSFSIEVVSYWELTGRNFDVYKSHSDSEGYSAVLNVAQDTRPSTSSFSSVFNSALSKIGNAAMTGISHVVEKASSAAAMTAVYSAVNYGRTSTQSLTSV